MDPIIETTQNKNQDDVLTIQTLIKRQRAYFAEGSTQSISKRKQLLKKFKKQIKKSEKEIIDALQQDFGKSAFETYLSEIGMIYQEINFIVSRLNDWTDIEKVPTPIYHFRSRSYLRRVPRGVTLIIGPWNYPFQLTLIPLLGAIAGGNTAILKPSELVPHAATVMSRIIEKVFDEGHVRVVEGDAPVVSNLLQQKFDYIFFTGSERVGKIVALAAARQLTPTTLELGGKSPCIVESDANIKMAAKRIIYGKLINGGQSCVAPDYVLVHHSKKEALISHMIQFVKQFYGEDPRQTSDYARIINENHFYRILSYLSSGKIVYGGQHDRSDLYIAPTIIDGVNWEDEIMQDEIFGPLLPILTYDRLEEIIQKINEKPRPLSLYFFSTSKKSEEKIIRSVNFGGGCINETMFHLGNPNLPFGGTGNSGMGAYHGKSSFDTFTQQKSILKKDTWLDIPIRYPPFKNKINLLRKIIR